MSGAIPGTLKVSNDVIADPSKRYKYLYGTNTCIVL